MRMTLFAGRVCFICHSLNKDKWRPNVVPGTSLGTRGTAVTKQSTSPCVCNTLPIVWSVCKSVYMWNYVELDVDL